MEETERLMTAAQKDYDEGAFQECLGLTEECRASGAAAMQWHERCAKRLERVSEDLLVGEGRPAWTRRSPPSWTRPARRWPKGATRT